jgi:hypothetical protein
MTKVMEIKRVMAKILMTKSNRHTKVMDTKVMDTKVMTNF